MKILIYSKRVYSILLLEDKKYFNFLCGNKFIEINN